MMVHNQSMMDHNMSAINHNVAQSMMGHLMPELELVSMAIHIVPTIRTNSQLAISYSIIIFIRSLGRHQAIINPGVCRGTYVRPLMPSIIELMAWKTS